jgi:hypothetical protein
VKDEQQEGLIREDERTWLLGQAACTSSSSSGISRLAFAKQQPPQGPHPTVCCAVLCCAVLCCAVLCCAVLCCAVCLSLQVVAFVILQLLLLHHQHWGAGEQQQQQQL